MNRSRWKCLVLGVVIVAGLLAVADQANAWWYGCCGTPAYRSYAYYAVSDGCCDGNWYLGVRPGPIRRLVFGPYRWYGGWYGSYGCCYPTYSCCYPTYSCCGDTVYGEVQGTVTTPAQPTPAQPTPAKKPVIEAPTPAVPGEPATPTMPPSPPLPGTEPSTPGTPTTEVIPGNSGMLTVWVPFDAKVSINGMATKSTGSRRQFVSYNLKEGMSYKYEVKAEVVLEGKIVEDTKTVVLTAGSENAVAFGFNIAPAEGLVAQ
ncbi:MAG: TIGR03000 domain-containing protein [Pirellulales bacterium]|nr:TIGR03000 domain-containing protein [Pirellulales bacterium]